LAAAAAAANGTSARSLDCGPDTHDRRERRAKAAADDDAATEPLFEWRNPVNLFRRLALMAQNRRITTDASQPAATDWPGAHESGEPVGRVRRSLPDDEARHEVSSCRERSCWSAAFTGQPAAAAANKKLTPSTRSTLALG
jgi:hypothetical protein